MEDHTDNMRTVVCSTLTPGQKHSVGMEIGMINASETCRSESHSPNSECVSGREQLEGLRLINYQCGQLCMCQSVQQCQQ